MPSPHHQSLTPGIGGRAALLKEFRQGISQFNEDFL